VARYQMPAVVEFRVELPYTALGKLDRRALVG
jgi:fatty-acyl-CoA synthase